MIPLVQPKWEADTGQFQNTCGTVGCVLTSNSNTIAAGIGDPIYNVKVSYGRSWSGPHIDDNLIRWYKDITTQIGFFAREQKIKMWAKITSAPPSNVIPYTLTLTGLARAGRVITLEGEDAYYIETPFAVDAAGNRTLCALSDTEITIPQEFLDAAVYPVYLDPTVTSTVDDAAFDLHGSNRYIHYANGHFWLAFYDGAYIRVYQAETVGGTWNFRTNVNVSINVGDSAKWCAFYWEGNYLYAAMCDDDANHTYYRRLTLNSNGTITEKWPASSDDDIGTSGSSFHSYPAIFKTSANKLVVTQNGYTILSRPEAIWFGSALTSPVWTEPTHPVAGPSGRGSRVALHHGEDTGDVVAICPCSHGVETAYRDIWSAYWDDSAGSWSGWVLDEPFNGTTYPAHYYSYYYSTCQTDDGKIWIFWLNQATSPNFQGSLGHLNSASWNGDITLVSSDVTDGAGATGNGLRNGICTDGTDIWCVWHDYDAVGAAYTAKIYIRKYRVADAEWDDAVVLADAGSDQYIGGNQPYYYDGTIYVPTVLEETVGGQTYAVVLTYEAGGAAESTGHLEPIDYGTLIPDTRHTHTASGTGELVAEGQDFIVWGDDVVFVGRSKAEAESQRYAIPANSHARVISNGELWIDGTTGSIIGVHKRR
jgi:hypothetical protein